VVGCQSDASVELLLDPMNRSRLSLSLRLQQDTETRQAEDGDTVL